MRLISIGKSSSCTVCIPNDYVSSYHAEILLLDNGDIFLTDCGSKNGTFLNGKRISPNVDVPVHRGDRIEFDTVSLNWGVIPQIPLPDPSKVKGIYGVGKNQRNRYTLSGDSVSRYHATFKEMKNGKWFIQDHSKNGTFINGNKITSNQDVPVKASDSIVCGTVPCPNPVPSPAVPKWAWWTAGGAVAAILLVFAFIHVDPMGKDTDPYKATVFVHQTYRIKVKFEDDPVREKLGELFGIEDWYISAGPTLAINKSDAWVKYHTGTAFFISEKGLLLTNRHVTNLIYADKHYNGGTIVSELKSDVERTRKATYKDFKDMFGPLSAEAELMFDRWLKSSYTLEIETISFGVRYPGRTYSSSSELDWAHLVSESSDEEADVALLRLNSRKTPEFCDWFDINKTVKVKDLKRDATYYTIGFSGGAAQATALDKDRYEPTSGNLHLVQSPGKYTLFFQGDTNNGGASGSPIYDKKHRLVGVLYGGFTAIASSTNACPISFAQELVIDAMQNDNTELSFKSNNAY